MPTYEYECPKGHRFEKFYPKVSSQRHATCPTCGKRAQRLISGGAGLVFKGSGFYITDYKRAGEGRKGDAEAKSEGRSEGKSEAKPGAKPETKSEPRADSKSKKDSSHK
jgi:putative FmdB family regulatory protein